MVTMAQRITELRTERNMSRPELSAALGLPRNAAEKFETGRATPTQEQQNRMADFFGVSLLYLKGESNDRTRQDSWMEGHFEEEEPVYIPTFKAAPTPSRSAPASSSGGSLLEPLMNNPAFREMIQKSLLELLRSPEGQDILARAIRRELNKLA